ncbi:MAG: hypothetical protein QM703_20760 [Gemmatales bacterium]
MPNLKQYGLVRIRELQQPPSHYDGWKLNKRPPREGDIGALLEILHAKGAPDRYVVELSDNEGVTVWLGDFLAEELEAIEEQ